MSVPSETLLAMGRRKPLSYLAAACLLIVSCSAAESVNETTSTTSLTVPPTSSIIETLIESDSAPVDEEDASETDEGEGHFDPEYWEEPPKWWPEVKAIYERNPNLLTASQFPEWVEVPSSADESSVMFIGDRVLRWRIHPSWVRRCVPGSCVYTSGEFGSGYVSAWGGKDSRLISDDKLNYGDSYRLEPPRQFLKEETKPLDCQSGEDEPQIGPIDMYPELWFAACVGTLDNYKTARIEMFRLNEDCQPYGSSHGTWISWEWASATTINHFVTSLAIQMLADRIECVTLETLLAMTYGYGYREGDFSGLDPELFTIWVEELQRRIGADVDGFYGPQTRDLHFKAAPQRRLNNISLVSTTPCGTFKMLAEKQEWEALEGLIVEWDSSDKTWLKESAQLEPPGRVRRGEQAWWEEFEDGVGTFPSPRVFLYPPLPEGDIYTVDVTGDGVNDFVMVWGGSVASSTAIATNDQRSGSCEEWRYIDAPNEIQLAVFPAEHDVWLATGKTYEDSQGNRCQSPGWNTSYVWYNPETDGFWSTVCLYY